MVSIDHNSFPHIVEAILCNVPRAVLPSLRGLSRSVRDVLDIQLARHVVFHPERGTPANVTAVFGTSPPPVAAAVETMLAVDLGASSPAPQATAATTTTTTTATAAVILAAKYFTVAAAVRDKVQLAPAMERRLARDAAALAHAQIVDLVGDIPPSSWGMIPRASTVRIFPTWGEDRVADSAFLALEAVRPDTAVLFTRLARQARNALSSHNDQVHAAHRRRQFPRTRRLVAHVTPPEDAYRGVGARCWRRVEVWTPPGRGFQADDEIVYIFHEDWRTAWQYAPPPSYFWTHGGPHFHPYGRPHRSLPQWGDKSVSFLAPLFVAMGEALEHVPRVTVVGLDEIPVRIMMLDSPHKQERIEAMRKMPYKVIERECKVTNRKPASWDVQHDDDPSELMYRLVFSDIIKDAHATDDDMRDYLDAQVRAGASINTPDWHEQRQADLRHCRDKFRQYLIDCMQCASREQHCPDDPDQVLWFQPPQAWDRERFEQLVNDKVSFLSHNAYRNVVGDEQWRVETTAYPWPPEKDRRVAIRVGRHMVPRR